MTVQYQGVWTLQSAAQLQSTQRWVTDPLFENTTLLLQADDAANGSQNNTFLDSSSNNFAIARLPTSGPNAPTQGSFTPFSSQPGAWSNYFISPNYLRIAYNAAFLWSTGARTFEAWVYLNSTSSNNAIFGLDNESSSNTWELFVNTSGQVVFRYYNGASQTVTTTSTVSTNAWTHIAFTYDGTSVITLYINGVSAGTGTKQGTPITDNNPLLIAHTLIGLAGNAYFNGYISNVRFTSAVVYTGNFTPSTTPLTPITNTSLLTCQSNRFVDNSTNAFAITVINTPSVQAFSPFAPQFQWTPSVIGGSGFFDGTTDMLETPSITIGTNNFCFECWLYPTAGQGATTGIFTANTNNGLQLSYFGTTGLGIAQKGVVFQINGTGIPIVNAWNHVAFVRSGTGTNQTSIFLNGARIANGTVSYSYAASLYQLSTTNAGGTVFQGYIAGARLTNGSTPYDATQSTITIPTTPPTAITNTSLLLNFTNAGIVDGTMKNNLETVGNAQVSTAVVKYGSGSMFFDGTGDYLRIPTSQTNSLGSGDWTIEFWIYRVGSGNQIFYDQRSTATQVAVTIYNDGSNILQFFVNGANRITGPTFPSSIWTHVAVSKFNSSTRMFVNGVQVGSTYADTNTYVNNPIFVGAQFDGSGTLNGYIDDLRVTLGIARYTQNFIPPSVALPRQ